MEKQFSISTLLISFVKGQKVKPGLNFETDSRCTYSVIQKQLVQISLFNNKYGVLYNFFQFFAWSLKQNQSSVAGSQIEWFSFLFSYLFDPRLTILIQNLDSKTGQNQFSTLLKSRGVMRLVLTIFFYSKLTSTLFSF